MFHYVARREELQRVAARLFARLKSGVLTAERGQAYPLAEAATAHAALESRNADGPLLLLP
jgi:NADPH2:quinone reductase